MTRKAIFSLDRLGQLGVVPSSPTSTDLPLYADNAANGTTRSKSRSISSYLPSNNNSSKQSSQQRFAPLSCKQMFYENRDASTRKWIDTNNGVIHGRFTRTQPSFWISIHRRNADKARWSIIGTGLYYETKESQSFVDIIRADVVAHKQNHQQQRQQLQKSGADTTAAASLTDSLVLLAPIYVIDVGGNIGWYSLISIATALEQHSPIVVDVFEPNPRNHPRLCESLFLNEWIHHDLVTLNLYPIGVTSTNIASNDTTAVGLMDTQHSPGRGSLGATGRKNSMTASFPLVSLDQMAEDLDWMRRNISILKVDVEGYELDVFEGARELLRSHVVQNIFFEGNPQTDQLQSDFRRMASILIDSGYGPYMVGGFQGADTKVKAKMHTSSTRRKNANISNLDIYLDNVLNECRGITRRGKFKRRQCNMWWRLGSP